MIVSATELKTNVGRILSLVNTEDVYITKNGKIIAKMSAPDQDKLSLLDSLAGIIPSNNATLDSIREERLAKQ